MTFGSICSARIISVGCPSLDAGEIRSIDFCVALYRFQFTATRHFELHPRGQQFGQIGQSHRGALLQAHTCNSSAAKEFRPGVRTLAAEDGAA